MEMIKRVRWYNKTKYIDKFKLYVKKCSYIAWSVEKIQKVKIQEIKRIMLLSECAVCGSKKSKFIKQL